MSFPSVVTTEPNPGSPGGMSLVVGATMTRDQMDALQPMYEKLSEEHLMRDHDRPILQTELRLEDECIDPGGKLSHLQTLSIYVEDDTGVSQPRPGSPQRIISVTMSDQSKVSDARSSRRSRGRGMLDVLGVENVREGGAGRSQFLWRNPNIVVESPFNVHNYQVGMLGYQPQGLAAALTEIRPDLLPPYKKPQGLQAVLFFDGSEDECFPDQEIIEGKNGASSVDYKHDFMSVQEQPTSSAEPGAFEAFDPCLSGYFDSKSGSYEFDYCQDGEDRKRTDSFENTLPQRNNLEKSSNLQILQSLPQDLVSTLVKNHSRRFNAPENSEDPERGSRGTPQRLSNRSVADDERCEGPPRRSRDDRSMNVQDSGSSTYTSYFTNSNSRVNGNSRQEDRGSQRNSQNFHDGAEQSQAGYKSRKSQRRSKHRSSGTPGSSNTSNYTTSTARGDGSYQEGRSRQKSSRKSLEGVGEEREVHHDGLPLPSLLPGEGQKDLRRKTRKSSRLRESAGSVSFHSSDMSSDERRQYGSTSRTKSLTDSYQERQPSVQTRDPTDIASSTAKETEDKMLSISKLLNNMSSITQLLSNFPLPMPGGNQPWNQPSSQDVEGGNNVNRSSEGFPLNDGNWQFDSNERPSQLLIEGAPQTNQMPFDISQHTQFLDGGGPTQPRSTSDNLPSQDVRLSQMHTNIQGANFQQFDALNSRMSQHLNNQRSSQMMNGGASQVNVQDPNFQQFDAMNQRQSQLLGSRLSHFGLQNDGSLLLGTLNRSSQLNEVSGDGYAHPDITRRQQSELVTQRLSQPNMQGDNSQQSSPTDARHSLHSRPSQLGSHDTLSNRASQLARVQRQSHKSSHHLDNFNNRPSQLNTQNDNFQQSLPMDSRLSQMRNGTLSQRDLRGTDVQQFDAMNNRLSQMDMQDDNSRMRHNLSMRPSQFQKESSSQVNLEGQDSQHFQALDNQGLPLQNSKQSRDRVQDRNLQQFDAQGASARPSQLGTCTDGSWVMNNMSRPLQLDMQGLPQFDSMDSRPSQLLNTSPSELYIQGDGLQQGNNISNLPSPHMNTRPSQTGIRDDNFQLYNPMNSRQSELLNARLLQTNLQDDGLQQFDTGPSQILNNRPSKMNIRPSQLDARPSQIYMLGYQEYDPLNPKPSHLIKTRPSHIGMQEDDFQQIDPINQRPSHLLDTRSSQIEMPDADFQEKDTMNQRPSQVFNTGSSPSGMQENNFQPFVPVDQGPSQPVNTPRPSQGGVVHYDLQQYDHMNARPSFLRNIRSSQINMRQSQLLNHRPSQVGIQYDGLHHYDSINSRKSQPFDNKPSQNRMQDDGLYEYDPMNPRPSVPGNTRQSQMAMRQSQVLNTRPSQVGFQEFEIVNPRQSQLLSIRPSQVGMQNDDIHQTDHMNPRASYLLNTRASETGMHDDDLPLYDSLSLRPSHIKEARPSQRPSHVENFRPSQSDLQSSMPSSMSLICDNCFETGHEALSCITQLCFICEEPGHYARFCLKPKAMHDTAHYADPAVMEERDITHDYDSGADVGSDNADHIGESQPQAYLPLRMMTIHPTSGNTHTHPGAEFRQSVNQAEQESHTVQQLEFLESQGLRKSLAQTLSNMLQEVQELETRSQQSSLAYLQKSMAAQSGRIQRSSKSASSNHKPSLVSMTERANSRFLTCTPQRSRPDSRAYRSGSKTRITSKLVKNVSRETNEEDIRKFRTSEWLSNLPTLRM